MTTPTGFRAVLVPGAGLGGVDQIGCAGSAEYHRADFSEFAREVRCGLPGCHMGYLAEPSQHLHTGASLVGFLIEIKSN